MTQSPATHTGTISDPTARTPFLALFLGAAVWLVLGSVFGLIASIKFHNPNFLADCAALTYGRVRPAAQNCLLYGFCVQAGIGVTLWLFSHLGRARLAHAAMLFVGTLVLNLAVLVGVGGILAGDNTGYETLEFPGYAAALLALAYLVIGVSAGLTFHLRATRKLYVSQWFLLAALFWFPWIYFTAELLLVTYHVRGMAQAAIAWWYAANLQYVWLWLVGLGTAAYFLPAWSGKPLSNRNLALFVFWTLLLFAPWTGISNAAPVPGWMPALSTVAAVMLILPLMGVAIAARETASQPGQSAVVPQARFASFGIASFLVAGALVILRGLPILHGTLNLTWLAPASNLLNVYGFFAMVIFGAVYTIVPAVAGVAFSRKLVVAHFWCAALGIGFAVLPLLIAGVLEAVRVQNPNIAFIDIFKGSLHLLRVSTLGDLLLLVGNALFLLNITSAAVAYYRRAFEPVYETAIAETFNTAEVKS